MFWQKLGNLAHLRFFGKNGENSPYLQKSKFGKKITL
jgi:hypothetical protein